MITIAMKEKTKREQQRWRAALAERSAALHRARELTAAGLGAAAPPNEVLRRSVSCNEPEQRRTNDGRCLLRWPTHPRPILSVDNDRRPVTVDVIYPHLSASYKALKHASHRAALLRYCCACHSTGKICLSCDADLKSARTLLRIALRRSVHARRSMASRCQLAAAAGCHLVARAPHPRAHLAWCVGTRQHANRRRGSEPVVGARIRERC